MIRKTFLAATAVAAFVAASPAIAQTPAPQNQAEIQGWVDELRGLHMQLENLQQQALADPTLMEEQQDLADAIETEMSGLDQDAQARIDRMAELEGLAMEAQRNGDQEQFARLVQEGQALQQQLLMLQQQILAKPAINTRVEAFQDHLEEKMVSIDPGAENLLERFAELQARVAAALQPDA